MSALGWGAAAAGVVALGVLVLVPEWTMFPTQTVQLGPPPTSMLLFQNGQKVEPVPQVPPPVVPVSAGQAPPAGGFKNVQVLTDVAPAEFMRLQQAITEWVSPKQGCAFCHTEGDFASDAKPQKVAARLMLQMTRQINADWGNHVATAGVTCFTCHRGQPVPAETWFPQPPAKERKFVAIQEPYQEAADTVRKFFPDNGWAEYYLQNEPISAQSLTALPSGQVHATIVVKRIYEMMMQMSDGMGVNCGYCHNSRAFWDWSQSTPQRWTAHYAIEQVRQINNQFLLNLSNQIAMTRTRVHETSLPVLPASETGVMEGNGFVVCATCHYAQPKPMGGANVIADYPSLVGQKSAPKTTSDSPAPVLQPTAEQAELAPQPQ